jgi:alkanesulfonate monooxygenase
MSINAIGLLSPFEGSEASPSRHGFDAGYLQRSAQAFEAAGYDRVLIGQNARSTDPTAVAAFVSGCTTTLKFMIAHRPGFIAPTMAARLFATIDQISHGRAGVHIITAASDLETQNDGDFLTKEERYHRSAEYVRILRRCWDASAPIDHDGTYYRFRGAFSEVKPVNGQIPVFWGGASALAVRYAGELADMYALGGGSVSQVAELVAAVKRQAAQHGRSPQFSMSMRIIMADTHDAAWDRAYALLAAIEARQQTSGALGRDLGEDMLRRVTDAAEAATRDADKCLWTGLTLAVRGRTHIMSLVGDPQDLTEALAAYYDVGVDNFLITGFEPIVDTLAIGRDLLPRLRAATAERPILAVG